MSTDEEWQDVVKLHNTAWESVYFRILRLSIPDRVPYWAELTSITKGSESAYRLYERTCRVEIEELNQFKERI